MSHLMMHSYVPYITASGLKALPYSHAHGSVMWKSNQLGNPWMPLDLGGGIDWNSVWGGAHLNQPAVVTGCSGGSKVVDGMRRLGLGVDDSDDIFAEVGRAMRTRRQRRLR